MSEGEDLRDDGIERVLANAANAEWKDRAHVWIATRPRGERITSTDVIAAVGMPPVPRAVGALIRTAAVQGDLIRTDEIVASPRPIRHAGIVRVWVIP